MSEHTNSRDRVMPDTEGIPEEGHPLAASVRLDQLLSTAEAELSHSLEQVLDLDGGIQLLAALPEFPSPSRWTDISIPGTEAATSSDRLVKQSGEEIPTDINGQLQQALDLLQHVREQCHDLVRMMDESSSVLESARSKLANAQLKVTHLIAEALSRTLTRSQNTMVFDEIHHCVSAAWTTIARALGSPAGDHQAVLLDDALDTLDATTQRLTLAHHILDRLLDQIGEDLGQPLPA
ncbi:hypothetical protein ABZ353_13795 [Streptomyces niveus]|uniref:hypothetical protein n=1 Tax=Streptomyces niveus TaxID=193462 RepID=UPI0013314300|nr:hypothetical protein [Streptomyces niveus]